MKDILYHETRKQKMGVGKLMLKGLEKAKQGQILEVRDSYIQGSRRCALALALEGMSTSSYIIDRLNESGFVTSRMLAECLCIDKKLARNISIRHLGGDSAWKIAHDLINGTFTVEKLNLKHFFFSVIENVKAYSASINLPELD
jgi:hypothetical protein